MNFMRLNHFIYIKNPLFLPITILLCEWRLIKLGFQAQAIAETINHRSMAMA